MNIFKTDDFSKLRAMCWYQPFGSLMLHGKIETREWKKNFNVRGTFLIYTSKRPATEKQLSEWCGENIISNINKTLKGDHTKALHGYAIGLADLVFYGLMRPEHEEKCYVKWNENKKILLFENVRRIEPFKYNFGCQGISFVRESEKEKIKIL